MKKTSRYEPSAGILAASNALRVLELLPPDGGLRVVDVAAELGVANSTAHRLLGTLRELGYVHQRAGGGRYEVGPALVRLARRHNADQDLGRLAGPYLEALRDKINETVNLLVLDGHEVVFIASREDTHRLRVAQRSGSRSPAYASAGGRMLLAGLDDDRVRAMYPSALERLTPRTVATVAELLERLSETRRRGYAVNFGEIDADVNAIAVAIPGTNGRPIAALSVAAPATRLTEPRVPEMLQLLRATSAAIAERRAESG